MIVYARCVGTGSLLTFQHFTVAAGAMYVICNLLSLPGAHDWSAAYPNCAAIGGPIWTHDGWQLTSAIVGNLLATDRQSNPSR